MSLFFQAIEKIAYFARKADVVGEPRISISFDTERDKAYFERELKREWPTSMKTWQETPDEFTYYGVRVRIL